MADAIHRAEPRNRRQPTIKIASVNILILLIGLFAIELVFGGWIRSNALTRLNIPRNVSIRFRVSDLYPSEAGYVTYTRDADGFRGRYESPDTIGILTVGGSTTDQRAMSDGDTWQDVLANAFAAAGHPVSVVNAGIDGQTTYGHLKNFDVWFPAIQNLSPQYVLFYVGLNDFYFGADNDYDVLESAPPDSPAALVAEKSAVYYLYRTLRGLYLANVIHGLNHRRVPFASLELVHAPLLENHAELMRDKLVAYESRLRRLTELARNLKAEPIFVTQRSFTYKTDGGLVGIEPFMDYAGQRMNGVDHYLMMNLLNQSTLSACVETGAICVDLARELVFDDADFYDLTHNTPRGAVKIGQYLFSRLSGIPLAHLHHAMVQQCL